MKVHRVGKAAVLTFLCVLMVNSCRESNREKIRTLQSDNEKLRTQVEALYAENARLKAYVSTIEKKDSRPKGAVTTHIHHDPQLDLHPSLGNPNAKVAIIEFSDYQCSFCRRHHQSTFQEIKHRLINTGRVQYQVWDYPLENHPQAVDAAVAARCAGRQNRLWEMNDALFSNNGRLGYEQYQTLASNLNLNLPDFTLCLQDQSMRDKVVYDLSYGKQFGVEGTPSFLIGEVSGDALVKVRKLRGAKPFQRFADIVADIEAQLPNDEFH